MRIGGMLAMKGLCKSPGALQVLEIIREQMERT